MKRHYGKKRTSWSERRRVWGHPYIGRRFHDIRRGFITITKAWKDRDFFYPCRSAGAQTSLTFEYKTDGGLRFIENGSRLFPNISFEDGSLPDELTMIHGVSRETMGFPDDWRHVAPRTVEDVLDDFYHEVGGNVTFEEWDEIVAKYVSELMVKEDG